MSIEEHKLQINYTVRYFTSGNPDAEDVWFIFHGQGQLPQYFSKKFSAIESSERLLVFPEGLNRYYLDGFYGRVGATWMTREDRETDIQNYLLYLDAVYKLVLGERTPSRSTILGFSQGAATASRWIANGNFNVNILLGQLTQYDTFLSKLLE